MRLIIKGVEIQISDKTNIARTLQVNDILTISSRQSNYTNTFNIPKTANNIKAFEKLGIIGVNSRVPYERNETYLYADSGECLIFNGWAVINSLSDEYKINCYDGNIDLYKAIENKSLSDLPLEEINHTKNIENVVASWDEASPYRYIIADYNGKALFDGNKINIDYLIPSVNVKWLWDKVFSFYNFTYQGSVFDTFNFQNLWMTFPKGVLSLTPDVEIFNLNTYDFVVGTTRGQVLLNTYSINSSFASVVGGWNIVFTESSNYRINIEANFRFYRLPSENINPARLKMVRNQFITNLDYVVNPIEVIPPHYDENKTNEFIITAEAGESIFFYVELDVAQSSGTDIGDTSLDIIINKTDSQEIDFTTALIDFKTKDFITEVLNRFSLTPFKDKYTNNYRFLTLQELLQDNTVIDWSAERSKFVNQIDERYVFGSYSQENLLQYKYNDEQSNYNDASLNVDNVNLDDSRVSFQSKIYSPERIKTNIFERATNVYKLWNKEPKDDGSVNYKPLDKRFYFMRSEYYYFDVPTTIGSEILLTSQEVNSAPFESFFKLTFEDIINDYYLNINQILNDSKIIDANIFLKEKDIVDIDFSKLYWIRELNSYFLLNKVSNFNGNGIVKCELIKVDYVLPSEFELQSFDITFVELYVDEIDVSYALYNGSFNPDFFAAGLITYVLDGGVPVSIDDSGLFSFSVPLSYPQIAHTIYITDGITSSVTKTIIS